MKGMKIVGALAALALLGATAVSASQGRGRWGGWCGGPPGEAQGAKADPAVEQLRGELFAKRDEIRREMDVEKPDWDRVGALQKEAVDIRVKLAKAGDAPGVAARGWGRGRGRGWRGGDGRRGGGWSAPGPDCGCRDRGW